jgi:hypothetical protein
MGRNSAPVIPAEAGTQTRYRFDHARQPVWIPACAGMTQAGWGLV